MKKGEMTAKTIVAIVLVLLGMAIVILLYLQINWHDTIDREACKESVVLRGTLPSFGGAKELAPLKCKTSKICVTSPGIFNNAKCNFPESEKIIRIKTDDIQDIEKAVANEIVDCWNMMGQGKILLSTEWFAKTYGLGRIGSFCVICSRIRFDKENLEKVGINENEMKNNFDIMKYMATRELPGKNVTYLDYIGSTSNTKVQIKRDLDVQKIENVLESLKEKAKEEQMNEDEINNIGKSALEKNYDNQMEDLAVVFMQITGPEHGKVFRNTMDVLGLGLGGSFALAPIMMIKTLTSGTFWKIVLPVGVLIGGAMQVNVAWNRAVTAGYCGDVKLGSEARSGCSVVRTVNYNVEDISKYCSGRIESIP